MVKKEKQEKSKSSDNKSGAPKKGVEVLAVDKDTVVKWEGEEYLQREKNIGWYIGLFLVGAALVALSIFLQWWTFTALVVLSVISLFLYSTRPPRKIKYTLSRRGLKEGEGRLYKFEDYKAFSLLQDEGHYAIILRPVKKFAPAVTVFFPETEGEKIVDMFGMRLPMEEVKLDILDKIVRMLRI